VTSSLRSARTCLARSATLRRIQSQLEDQQALLARVRACLPPGLAPHCQVSVLTGDRLSLYTESPAWASRLRYMQREITAQLTQQGFPIRELRVRINIADSQPAFREQWQSQPLSAANAKLLRSIASGVTDPDLRRALERLSSHVA